MATTAIIAEILIVGIQALVWLGLLAVGLNGSDWFPTDEAERFEVLFTLLATAVAYMLGVVIDRGADTLFDGVGTRHAQDFKPSPIAAWWARLRPSKPNPRLGLGRMRMEIMTEESGVSPFLEYQRSRLRISRSTLLNLFLAIPATWVYVFRQVGGNPREQLFVVLLLTTALLGAAYLTWRVYVRVYAAYLARLEDAHRSVIERARRREQTRD